MKEGEDKMVVSLPALPASLVLRRDFWSLKAPQLTTGFDNHNISKGKKQARQVGTKESKYYEGKLNKTGPNDMVRRMSSREQADQRKDERSKQNQRRPNKIQQGGIR